MADGEHVEDLGRGVDARGVATGRHDPRTDAAEAVREVDLLDGLGRIGIDEISHCKGQRYLTVVVDHHTGRLAPGRDRRTVLAFFDALGQERCKQIEFLARQMKKP